MASPSTQQYNWLVSLLCKLLLWIEYNGDITSAVRELRWKVEDKWCGCEQCRGRREGRKNG